VQPGLKMQSSGRGNKLDRRESTIALRNDCGIIMNQIETSKSRRSLEKQSLDEDT
jgi:hypothetical protein